MSTAAPPYDHDHENEITPFAETNFRNARLKFGIKTDDRRRHTYVIGKTGMGKTNLLETMVLSDVKAGHGLAYIDPHGDTAKKLLDFIPANRINDVVYFNPGDLEFPIGFNILESVPPEFKSRVANGLLGVFKKIWPDVWSSRMEHILNNCILALLDVPGSTLLGVNRILVDNEYRKEVVSLIQDPVVKTFWSKEFAAWAEKYRTEAIAPLQNKVGQFLSSFIIRNIVAQVKSTIDMRDIMDNRKILIVNLSKGIIGEENSRLLGAILITKIQLAAMERVDIVDESDRQDFYLYVDEFQNFATESFADILSEARKYRLNLIVAHQYIEQLDEKVAAAVFGNVGTLISFRVGGTDALKLEAEFTPQFTAEDLVNLQKYDIYLKLMIDGAASEPFSASTLDSRNYPRTNNEEKVVRVSRERYARGKQDVEEKVLRWSGFGTTDEGVEIGEPDEEEVERSEKLAALAASSPKISGPEPKSADNKPLYEIACSVCGKIQKLTFQPDYSRPWFCKEHLEARKAGTLKSVPRVEPRGESRPPLAPPAGTSQSSAPSVPVSLASRSVAPPSPSQRIGAPIIVESSEKPVSLGDMFGKKIDAGQGEMEVVADDGDGSSNRTVSVSRTPPAALPKPSASSPMRAAPQQRPPHRESGSRRRRGGAGTHRDGGSSSNGPMPPPQGGTRPAHPASGPGPQQGPKPSPMKPGEVIKF